MNKPEQTTLFHFCGECRRMRPGSTMFRCDHSDSGPEWESLVFPDTEACRDFLPGKSRFRVSPHGLIEKIPATP